MSCLLTLSRPLFLLRPLRTWHRGRATCASWLHWKWGAIHHNMACQQNDNVVVLAWALSTELTSLWVKRLYFTNQTTKSVFARIREGWLEQQSAAKMKLGCCSRSRWSSASLSCYMRDIWWGRMWTSSTMVLLTFSWVHTQTCKNPHGGQLTFPNVKITFQRRYQIQPFNGEFKTTLEIVLNMLFY